MTTETATTRAAGADRPTLLFVVWGLLLLAGFALVVFLGSPLPTVEDELAAAYAPRSPVTEEAARRSAETIIQLQYPEFVAAAPVVDRRTDFSIERYVILYSDPERGAGVRISIVIATGKVDVSSFN